MRQQPYVLTPDMSDEAMDRIANNFITLAKLRAKNKRTLLKVSDEKRSDIQNKYYWVCVSFFANHLRENFEIEGEPMSYKPEVIHELLKKLFAVPKVTEFNGETVKIYRSTTDMTKKEFFDYMERIAAYCAMEWGCVLPPPDNGVSL